MLITVLAMRCAKSSVGLDIHRSQLSDECKVLSDYEVIFTCFGTFQIAALPIGIMLDRFGPKFAVLVGSVVFLLGGVGFAFSAFPGKPVNLFLRDFHLLAMDFYALSYSFLAFGGPFIFMGTLHLSRAFPSHSGLVMALLTGAFDMSSIVYFIFAKLHDLPNHSLGVKQFFLFYSVVPALIFLYGLLFMPSTPFSSDLFSSEEDQTSHQDSDELIPHSSLVYHQPLSPDQQPRTLMDLPLSRQLTSFEFW